MSITKSLPSTAVLLLLLAATAPPAAAQPTVMNADCGDKDWHGEANEFGKVCMKFQEEMVGQAVPVEARIVLNHLYEDRDAAYFLFMFNTQGTPFQLSDVKLTVDGNEIPIFKREEDKFFVDIVDMPRAGKTILLSAVADSCDEGLYQLGALVQPFNYRWQRIVMSNGQPADLYGFTQFGVNEASCKGGLVGLPKLEAPAGGLVAAVAAIGLVAFATRRRR